MPDNDNLSHEGAYVLAGKIRAYWMRKGHEVNVWVERFDLARGNMPIWVIRSDMLNGWPV